MNSHDLIIIGGGPAGYPLALRAAKKGWKVALIDGDQIGGTCLNWGCIPTKALLSSAKGYHFLKNCENLGLQTTKPGFSWEKIISRKDKVVSEFRTGIQKLLDKSGVKVVSGHARLFPGNRILVKGSENWEGSAGKICLAVGSKPFIPEAFSKIRNLCWTSDEAINAKKIPEDLLIIGGGVIGLELGQVFNEFGSRVTIVEMMTQILPGLDSTTAKRVLPVFKKIGMEFLIGQKVEKCVENGSNVEVEINGEKRRFSQVLLAIGRKPNLSVLSETGMTLEMKGSAIAVNEKYETSLKDVYAIGDCIPGPMLAHRASYDAGILSSQWSGKTEVPDYSNVPSCVYTYPEIAWVGMSEENAKGSGAAYKVGRFLFSANGKALSSGEYDGQVKTIVNGEGKLLGAVIWGPEASNLIIEGVLARQFGIDLHKFSKVIHPHPTLTEVFLEGFENALGESIHG